MGCMDVGKSMNNESANSPASTLSDQVQWREIKIGNRIENNRINRASIQKPN